VSDKLFQEHPKWIDGVLVQNAAEERALGEPVTDSVGSADADQLSANPLLPPEYAAIRTRRLRRIAQVSQGRPVAAGYNP
jgi:hypothetical protein